VPSDRRSDSFAPGAPRADADARTRLLDTAYSLFSRYGIHTIGIDRIIAEAGVAKMTLYRHFASKDDLVLAFLELREQRWTHDWLRTEMERRATAPRDRLLAVFDALDEWFQRPDFESCSFLRTLVEVPDESDPVHQATVGYLETITKMLARQVRKAGIARPRDVALDLQVLMMGAILSATRGDRKAAVRARGTAEVVLDNGAASR
jgi:AcrR family transcriptional regulator